MADMVNECLKNQREMKEAIQGNKWVVVKLFNDRWYVGIHTFASSGYFLTGFSMNFNRDEWKLLQANFEKINGELGKAAQFRTSHINRKTVNDRKVLTYRWAVNCGAVKKVLESEGFFYLRRFAKASLNKAKEDPANSKYVGKRYSWVIVTEMNQAPDIYILLRATYVALIVMYMFDLRKEQCTGCQRDRPSQSDHLGEGGCSEDVDVKIVVDNYFASAKSRVSLVKIVTVINHIFDIIGIVPSWTYLYVECMVEFWNNAEVAQYLIDSGEKTRTDFEYAQIVKLVKYVVCMTHDEE
jgi:hypothetical protein